MPSRNVVREYVPESYYHVYNRGIEKRRVFLDAQDYNVFLSYVRRHLCVESEADSQGRLYTHYDSVDLLAYCLMPNHFHLMLHAHEDPSQIAKLMQSVCIAYSMYFNKRYKRVGNLFQSRFKAARVSNESYLQHISRYIHLNPTDYKNWQWSSLAYYLGEKSADWVHPDTILAMFNGDYKKFLDEYREQKSMLDIVKKEIGT